MNVGKKYKLPELFASDRVLVECSCGLLKPFTRMYFCRHCFALKCRDCVSQEVDSQYCQHCLEYIPTIDAKLKKNKCATCFQCPSCSHILTTRASVIQAPSTTDPNQLVPKKIFYLVCNFCRWSSKDVGIPDQQSGTGGWPEPETPNANRIDDLFEFYRVLAQKEKFEKLEKEKRRLNPSAGRAIHLLDKYGISASLSPKVSATLRAKIYGGKMSPSISSGDLKAANDAANVKPSVASDEIPALDTKSYYETELCEALTTGLEQRLNHVEVQPDRVSKFHPVSKMLLVKRSFRCKQCDHNVCKPEYNPCSIRFKIQLAAYYHLPELRIKHVPQLHHGKPAKVELTLQNPTPYLLHLTFLPDFEEMSQSAEVVLPQTEIQLAAKDETAELDVDQSNTASIHDDPQIISFRKSNKLGFYIQVCPTIKEGDCKISLKMKHDLTVIQVQGGGEREPQVTWLTHRIVINLGPVTSQ